MAERFGKGLVMVTVVWLMTAADASYARTRTAGNFEYAVTGTTAVSYDNNITWAPSDERSDVITVAAIGLTAACAGKTRQAELSARLKEQLFRRWDDFNNTSFDLDASLRQEFTPYDRLSVTESFVHAEEPRSFDDILGTISGRYSYTRNRLGLSYEHDNSKQLTVSYRLRHELDEYSTALLRDSWQLGAGATGEWLINSRCRAFASYDVSRRKYEDLGTTWSHTPAAGLRYYFSARSMLETLAGIDFIDPVSGDRETYPRLSLSLNNTIDEVSYARLEASLRHDTDAGSVFIKKSRRISVTLGRRLSRRLGGELSAFYGRAELRGGGVTDKLTGADTALVYDITEDITSRLGFLYSGVSSNVQSREYDKNTVTASISAMF
jgi:hypothetical protein